MPNLSLRCILGLAAVLVSASPSFAQRASDPLTRFLDGIFKPDAARNLPAGEAMPQLPQAAPTPSAEPQPDPRARPQAAPRASAGRDAQQRVVTPKPQPVRAAPLPPEVQPRPAEPSGPQPQARPVERAAGEAKPAVPEPRMPAGEPTTRAAEPSKPADAPAAQAAAPKPVAASTSAASAVPSSPAAALDRVNAYFNSIDQLTAYFVQNSPNGQRAEGTLSIRRPGQLHFAYAPPSTLEIISDGRSVAIRDKKLGTNDVYPIGQTPLKFLLQENVNLARDTKVQDVQVGRDGIVTVRFDDSATLGGTSKITLRFDARANALKQWTIIDSQGYETTVTLSDLNVVHRADARAAN